VPRRIFVIIPAYNEEESVGRVLEALQALPLQFGAIVVADNGSTDRTAVVANEHGALVLSEPQRGYGAACLRGISYLTAESRLQAASEDMIVFLDADYSDFPEDLPAILQPILSGEVDFVVGSRLITMEARAAVPIVARWGNAFATWIMRLLYKGSFTDLGPFRAITVGALQRLEMQDRTWGWTLEMQLKACERRVRYTEVAVRYRKRKEGKSKISGSVSGVLRASAKILWVLGKFTLTSALRKCSAAETRLSGE